MTINAAPNSEYETYCEEQPRGREWDGEFVNCLYRAENGQLALWQCGVFTRFRGDMDFHGYGDTYTADWVDAGDLYAAHFMVQ